MPRLRGEKVNITSKGGYESDYTLLQELNEVLDGSAIGELLSSIAGTSISSLLETVSGLEIMKKGLIPIPVGLNVRIGYSDIELKGSTNIWANADVNVLSNAIGYGEIIAKSSLFSIALGVGVGISKVQVLDTTHITSAAGNVLILSHTENDVRVLTATTDNESGITLPLSLAIEYLCTDLHRHRCQEYLYHFIRHHQRSGVG